MLLSPLLPSLLLQGHIVGEINRSRGQAEEVKVLDNEWNRKERKFLIGVRAGGQVAFDFFL